MKYFVANAPLATPVLELLRAAFTRWHVEQWFARAKQEAGLGAFEVRGYRSLMRHWLICRLAMFFLARETRRLREKNPRITLEQVAEAVNSLTECWWKRHWRMWRYLMERAAYWQWRNEASYASRRRKRFKINSS